MGAIVTVIGEVDKDPFGSSSSSSSCHGSMLVSTGAGALGTTRWGSGQLGLGSSGGEGVDGGDVNYVVRKSMGGSPFYITTQTLDQLQAAVASRARLIKVR